MGKMVLDDSADVEMVEIPKQIKRKKVTEAAPVEAPSTDELVNCLRNEKVTVRHIDRRKGKIADPKHVLYGGMAEGAKRTYTVPMLRSGMLVDVLTKSEKVFLENALGLEPNAMSVYKRENNFWSTDNDEGVSKVVLEKHGNILDLSNPIDYIKYKILLANKDYIAPSLAALQDTPKASYEFVIESEEENSKFAKLNMSSKMQSYKEYGKIEDDKDTLRFIIETMESKPLSANTKLDVLQVKINELIQANSTMFLKIISDPLLQTKVLIRKAVDVGVIAKRGNFLYLRDGNVPLCENNEDPTLNNAAKYIGAPKNQDLKFSIEAKVQAKTE